MQAKQSNSHTIKKITFTAKFVFSISLNNTKKCILVGNNEFLNNGNSFVLVKPKK